MNEGVPSSRAVVSQAARRITVYCHRKFGPLSKPRLWYTNNLLERSLRWRNENEEPSPPSFRSEVVLEALRGESSQAELCRCHNLSEDQLSKWKQQLLEKATSVFASTDQHSSEATERFARPSGSLGAPSIINRKRTLVNMSCESP